MESVHTEILLRINRRKKLINFSPAASTRRGSQASAELESLADSQLGHQRLLLHDVAKHVLARLQARVLYTVHHDVSLVPSSVLPACHYIQQRRFASSARSHDRVDTTLVLVEGKKEE